LGFTIEKNFFIEENLALLEVVLMQIQLNIIPKFLETSYLFQHSTLRKTVSALALILVYPTSVNAVDTTRKFIAKPIQETGFTASVYIILTIALVGCGVLLGRFRPKLSDPKHIITPDSNKKAFQNHLKTLFRSQLRLLQSGKITFDQLVKEIHPVFLKELMKSNAEVQTYIAGFAESFLSNYSDISITLLESDDTLNQILRLLDLKRREDLKQHIFKSLVATMNSQSKNYMWLLEKVPPGILCYYMNLVDGIWEEIIITKFVEHILSQEDKQETLEVHAKLFSYFQFITIQEQLYTQIKKDFKQNLECFPLSSFSIQNHPTLALLQDTQRKTLKEELLKETILEFRTRSLDYRWLRGKLGITMLEELCKQEPYKQEFRKSFLESFGKDAVTPHSPEFQQDRKFLGITKQIERDFKKPASP
jgi:hypothetical protein